MNRILVQATLWGMGLVLLTGSPVWAQAGADEQQLQATRSTIDRDTASNNKGTALQVQTLSKQFNVSPSLIESMRANKQGWGEITIQLAMAQHLTQTDPTTYPTLNDALTKIQSMRSDTMGWGRIAKELGFKLGPVVAAAERTRLQLLSQTSQQTSQTSQVSQERAGQVARQDRVDRPDRPQRPERPMMPERPFHR